jgi:hypothetical protein
MAQKNKRYRAVYVIDIFIEDDWLESDLDIHEYNEHKLSEAKIKAEEIKRTINEALNGCNIQINDVFENKFGSI